MNQSKINLLDLPNEIFLIILKKLDNIDVLYSLFDIHNQRLNNILQENSFTNTLNFVLTTSTDENLSRSDLVLDRFCLNILPRIHFNVKSLILHSLSMKRILLAADYPNLRKLKIFDFNSEIAACYLTVNTPFQYMFQRQITDLILVIDHTFNEISCEHYTTDVYGFILKFFGNLKHLSIIGSSPKIPSLVCRNLPVTTCYSSTLIKLSIHVMDYHDFIALLDGRLQQLKTLNVVFTDMGFDPRKVHNVYNLNNLPDLQSLDLNCDCSNDMYNIQILPLLRRMSNVEVLHLYLIVKKRMTLIDGTHIYNEIIAHMSRLRTFNFCFCTITRRDPLVNYLSRDDLLQTFSTIIYGQVNVIMKHQNPGVICHVFSLPFVFDYLKFIGYTFPSIIFDQVRSLAVDDDIPFNYEFFNRITWSFPLLKELIVLNLTPTSNKLSSGDDQLYLTTIEFPHLTSLNLGFVHISYVEQFLNDKKTHLPQLTKLTVSFDRLKIVTENFTSDRTRLNCMKVKQLNINRGTTVHREDFYLYFPAL